MPIVSGVPVIVTLRSGHPSSALEILMLAPEICLQTTRKKIIKLIHYGQSITNIYKKLFNTIDFLLDKFSSSKQKKQLFDLTMHLSEPAWASLVLRKQCNRMSNKYYSIGIK